MRVRTWLALSVLACFLSVPASATPVLVSQSPWGTNTDTQIMDNVFGNGNWTNYATYASANPASVFSAASTFVWLEGGDGTDSVWQAYVNANAAAILNWVSSGGALLTQSAGWNSLVTTLGPGTLSHTGYYSCGTLTSAGQAAFPTTAVSQCGNYLAHDTVLGTGLTAFMTENTGTAPIIAGTAFGSGYIMYSGLTDYQFHDAGASLLNNVVAYTAAQGAPVPEPESLLLLGTGLIGAVRAARKRRV